MHSIAKKTLALITHSSNHYLVKVKGNQPRLLRAIKAHIADSAPLSSLKQSESNRGRKEHREIEVYLAPETFDEGWTAVERVLCVTRSGQRAEGTYHRVGYYMSSLQADAHCFADGLRGHWLIENSLHYVKDVIANEDGSGIRSSKAAANLSLLKNLTLNIYRHQGYKSLKYASERFANKVKELLFILRT